MVKTKNSLRSKKRYLRAFIYKFLFSRAITRLFFAIGGAIIVSALTSVIGFLTDGSFYTYLPSIVWATFTVGLFVLFVVATKKISTRLRKEKAQATDKEFYLTDYKTAEINLQKTGLIVGGEIIFEETPVFGDDIKKSLPLSDCYVYFYSRICAGKVYYGLEFYAREDFFPLANVSLDKDFYTYFFQNSHMIANRETFMLFVKDKEEFLRLLFKYNDVNKIQKKLENKRFGFSDEG